MYALTVRLPWAALIAQGIKTVESRSWPTDHRGWLAIHAGLTHDKATPDAWELVDEYLELSAGCIVAVGRVVDVIADPGPHRWASAQAGWCHWVLGDVVPIEPIRCVGAQGLWVPPPEIVDHALDAVARRRLRAAV